MTRRPRSALRSDLATLWEDQLIRNRLTCGKTATINRAMHRPIINLISCGVSRLMEIPVMEEAINRFAATGGVIKAMDKASTRKRPYCMGSMP